MKKAPPLGVPGRAVRGGRERMRGRGCVLARGHGHGGARGPSRAAGGLRRAEGPPGWGMCVRRLRPRLFRGQSCERVSEAIILCVSMSAKGFCEPREPGVDVAYRARPEGEGRSGWDWWGFRWIVVPIKRFSPVGRLEVVLSPLGPGVGSGVL